MKPKTVLILAVLPLALNVACGQIYTAVFNPIANPASIGAYNLNGTPINPNLISGLGPGTFGLALDNSGHLFVANYYAGTVGEYATGGETVNATFISGLDHPTAIALDGMGSMYVIGGGKISQYSTSGALINASLVPFDLGVSWGLALDGQGHIFEMNYGVGSIGVFTTSGETVTFITGLNTPQALALDGNGHLFVGDNNGNIAEYTPDGTLLNPTFVTGLGAVKGLSYDGNGHLFVSSWPQRFFASAVISEYNTDGTVVNASILTVAEVENLVVAVPEPSCASLLLLGTAAMAIRRFGPGPTSRRSGKVESQRQTERSEFV